MRGMASNLFKYAAIVLLTSLLAVGLCSIAISQENPPTASLIVKMVTGLSAEEQLAVIERNGGVPKSSIPQLNMHVVEIPEADVEVVMQKYKDDPAVASLELNQTLKVEGIPNDTLVNEQWALPKIGWDQVYGVVNPSADYVARVAILDTGIDASHPDLAGVVLPGMSIFASGTNGMTDTNGHGTWLAGIVAAQTNNSEGIAGVAYAGVQVMPVQVIGDNGEGQDGDIVQGVIWAVENGADVILMGFSNPGFSPALQDAIDYAWENDVILVAAVGNDRLGDPTYPAGDRGVMGVSATDDTDTPASFSNSSLAVFLAAPGTDISSTALAQDYVSTSGTSASAAIVGGVAAFMRAVDPLLTNGMIVGRLARSADLASETDPAVAVTQVGNGRVNMEHALADTGTEEIQPAGVDGGGGPIVGPYRVATTKPTSVTLNPTSRSIGYGTSPVTYTITIGANGAGTMTLSTSSLPTNSTASFSPGISISCPGGTCPPVTLTLQTATVPVSTTAYSFSVIATGDDTRQTTSSGTGSLTVGKADQTITFGALSNKTYGDADFTISATASSELPVSFSSQNTSVCTVSGTTVNIVAAGTCKIRASQAGNDNYNAAPNVDQSFTVQQIPTTVTISGGPFTYDGNTHAATVETNPTGVSHTVNYSSTTPVYNSATPPTDAGTYTVTVTITDANYVLSGSGTGSITINKAPVTATAGSGSGTYNGSTQSPSACVVTGAYKGDLTCANNPAAVGPGAGTTTISPVVSGPGQENFYITLANGSYTINKADTSTSVTSSVNPSPFPMPVTFSATVTNHAATLTGTIQFKIGGHSLR